MRALNAVLILAAVFSGVAKAGIDDVCPITIFVSQSTLGDAWYAKPPAGYGRVFPWSSAQVKAAAEQLDWISTYTDTVSPARFVRLRNGQASYFLLAYNRAACPNGHPYVSARQANSLGSYEANGSVYELLAHRTSDNQYDQLLNYADGGLKFFYAADQTASVNPSTPAEPGLIAQGSVWGNDTHLTLSAQQALPVAAGEILRVDLTGNPGDCGPIVKLQSDDRVVEWKQQKVAGDEKASTTYFSPSQTTTVRAVTLELKTMFGSCDYAIRRQPAAP